MGLLQWAWPCISPLGFLDSGQLCLVTWLCCVVVPLAGCVLARHGLCMWPLLDRVGKVEMPSCLGLG